MMALDPLLKSLVDQIPAAPPTVDYPAYRTRAAAMIPMLYGADGPIRVDKVEEFGILGPSGTMPCYVYKPETPAKGTLLFFYGGGWALGSIDHIDVLARRFARDLSMVVVTSSYRLAPEHPFPAGLDDCLAAAQWVFDRTASLGGLGQPTVIGGDSAGANLAAAVAIVLRDAGGRNFDAQLLFNPALDLRPSSFANASRLADADPTLRVDTLPSLVRDYCAGHDPADCRISPLAAANLVGLPPAVIAVLSVDPLRDEAVAYAERLQDAGVAVDLVDFDNLTHGFAMWAALVPAAAVATADVLGRLTRLLALPTKAGSAKAALSSAG